MAEFTYLDIRKAREARKIPRWQLANQLGTSEDTLERWETGKAIPHPNDVSRIEHALSAEGEMLWYRWMYSNIDSFRERNPAQVVSELLAAVVSVRYELADVQALHDQLARDAIDGHIDDPKLRTQALKEISEARAALNRLQAQIRKGVTRMEEKLARVIADMLAPTIAETVREAIREVAPTAATPITVYTVEEAADLMRTSRNQILAYIRSGKLASFKLERDSRKNLIHSSDLMALVERLKQAG